MPLAGASVASGRAAPRNRACGSKLGEVTAQPCRNDDLTVVALRLDDRASGAKCAGVGAPMREAGRYFLTSASRISSSRTSERGGAGGASGAGAGAPALSRSICLMAMNSTKAMMRKLMTAVMKLP